VGVPGNAPVSARNRKFILDLCHQLCRRRKRSANRSRGQEKEEEAKAAGVQLPKTKLKVQKTGCGEKLARALNPDDDSADSSDEKTVEETTLLSLQDSEPTTADASASDEIDLRASRNKRIGDRICKK